MPGATTPLIPPPPLFATDHDYINSSSQTSHHVTLLSCAAWLMTRSDTGSFELLLNVLLISFLRKFYIVINDAQGNVLCDDTGGVGTMEEAVDCSSQNWNNSATDGVG